MKNVEKMGLNFLLKRLKVNKNAYYNYLKNIDRNKAKALKKTGNFAKNQGDLS